MREPAFISWRARMPGHVHEPDPEYLDAPFLTVMVNICTALGLFIGIWAAIYLAVDFHKGFGTYWSLVLILVIDVAVNVAVRMVRARKIREQYADLPAPSARRVERGP
jgi:hypothetical protein